MQVDSIAFPVTTPPRSPRAASLAPTDAADLAGGEGSSPGMSLAFLSSLEARLLALASEERQIEHEMVEPEVVALASAEGVTPRAARLTPGGTSGPSPPRSGHLEDTSAAQVMTIPRTLRVAQLCLLQHLTRGTWVWFLYGRLCKWTPSRPL